MVVFWFNRLLPHRQNIQPVDNVSRNVSRNINI